MYGADYANNLRKNLLKPTDSGLLERPMKADLKIYKDRDDVVEDALADLLPYIDIKPQVRDEIAAKKAQARQNEMTESTSRALVTDDDEVVTLDEANETESLVTKPVISPTSTLVFDPEADIDRAVEALKFLESGAYGVMESNVPLFTKKYYGEELTVEEFINNTKAQDEVAKEFILQNYQKYGNLEDAISTWFTGDPLDQAMDRGADDGSIDIEEYMIRFNSKFNPR